jgi:hypothetical protein
MRVVEWPKFLATTSNGMPFITACDAQVCRKLWKFASSMPAAFTASAMRRTWSERPQGFPSLLRNGNLSLANSAWPSSLRMTCRALPDFDCRMWSVPASALKSAGINLVKRWQDVAVDLVLGVPHGRRGATLGLQVR